jgi:putative redox protein
MNVTLNLVKNQTISGIDEDNISTIFDASKDHNGEGNGSSPMAVMLESMAACTFLDVLAMLRKKRKTINDFEIFVKSERADNHPRVFTKVHLHFVLTSPDTAIADLEKSVELSQTKYCGASAMFQRSGCEVSWECEINN